MVEFLANEDAAISSVPEGRKHVLAKKNEFLPLACQCLPKSCPMLAKFDRQFFRSCRVAFLVVSVGTVSTSDV